MRVFTVVYEEPVGATSGFGRVALRLSESFLSQGVESHIICTSPLAVANNVATEIAGVTIHRISVSGSPLSRIKFYQKAQTIIDTLSRRSDSNVFLLNAAYPLPLARGLKRRGLVVYSTFGTLLYELRSSISGIISPFNYRKLFMYSIDLAIETAFLRFADVLIVPHDRAAEEFRKVYGIKKEKIHVVPYGQDMYRRYHDADFFAEVDEFRNKFAQKKILLFVGGSEWHRKGAPYMLQAFRTIKEKLPAILIMTGKPAGEYLALAKRLRFHVGEDVLLTGFVDDKTLAKLYAASDVFVLPSLHEGFSQPVLEVMAYGKPVVASPLAAYPTVRNKVEGFVIDPNDTNGFADAIRTLLADKKAYSLMSDNARNRARQYSWENIGHGVLDLFKSLAK